MESRWRHGPHDLPSFVRRLRKCEKRLCSIRESGFPTALAPRISVCYSIRFIGSHKAMHAVIDLDCTGCGLCLDPCPVDCIDMQPITTEKNKQLKPYFKGLYEAKNQRAEAKKQSSNQHYRSHKASKADRLALIQQAMEDYEARSGAD